MCLLADVDSYEKTEIQVVFSATELSGNIPEDKHPNLLTLTRAAHLQGTHGDNNIFCGILATYPPVPPPPPPSLLPPPLLLERLGTRLQGIQNRTVYMHCSYTINLQALNAGMVFTEIISLFF